MCSAWRPHFVRAILAASTFRPHLNVNTLLENVDVFARSFCTLKRPHLNVDTMLASTFLCGQNVDVHIFLQQHSSALHDGTWTDYYGPWTVVGVPWPVNHGPQTMDPGLHECKHQPIWLSSIVGLLDAGRDVLKPIRRCSAGANPQKKFKTKCVFFVSRGFLLRGHFRSPDEKL